MRYGRVAKRTLCSLPGISYLTYNPDRRGDSIGMAALKWAGHLVYALVTIALVEYGVNVYRTGEVNLFRQSEALEQIRGDNGSDQEIDDAYKNLRFAH